MRSMRLDNGALVFTDTKSTAQAKSAEDLEAKNEALEQRVRERTEELQGLSYAFARATAEVENAKVSKTRFLAAASQTCCNLSAAKLYTTSPRERRPVQCADKETMTLALSIDAALEVVEDILGALLEISHFQGGKSTRTASASPASAATRPCGSAVVREAAWRAAGRRSPRNLSRVARAGH